jgi:MFS family permease
MPAATPTDRRLGPLLLLESAVLISGIGNGIASIALPWLILQRTGQPTAAGIVGAATALPLLLAALFSGSLVDTLGRRRTSVVSDVFSALSVAAIPLVDRWLGLDLTLIVILAVVGSLFDPAGATAREAMLPEVGALAGWPIDRLNSVHESVWGVAYLIGPGVGGVLIAAIGAVNTLWAITVGFVLSAILIAFVRAPGAGRPERADRPDNVLAGSLEGVRLVWNDPLLRDMTWLSMALVAVYMPIEGVILPVLFEKRDASAALGLVLTALAAGGIVGALSYGALSGRFRRYRVFTAAMVLASVSILGMALAPAYWMLVAAAALAGFFWGPVDPLINVAMQTRTDPTKRGRVLGVLMAAGYAAGPVGYLVAGPVVERVGAQTTFVAVGVIITAVAIAGSLLPSLRKLDEPGRFAAHLDPQDCRPPASDRGL